MSPSDQRWFWGHWELQWWRGPCNQEMAVGTREEDGKGCRRLNPTLPIIHSPTPHSNNIGYICTQPPLISHMYHASFQYHQGITSDCGGSTDFSICYKFLNVMVFFSPVLGEMIKSSRTSFARASSIFLSRFSAITMSFVAFYTMKWCSHVYILPYTFTHLSPLLAQLS